MTFEKFEKAYKEEVNISPDYLRKGQILMNFLYSAWNQEYRRLSSLHFYDKTDIDCFYNDKLIPKTLDHLKKVWVNYPN